MSKSAKPKGSLSPEIQDFYGRFDEKNRLLSGIGQLERVRTQDILERHLPTAPAVILDVGGGAGVHSFWLAERGYEVHLVDPVSAHIDQAREEARKHPDHPLASLRVTDASCLGQPDSSVDAVLLLGPLYHLTEKKDRMRALEEVRRVLLTDGWVFAAAISRFASVLDGLFHGYLDDPEFVRIVYRDLESGQHRNPTSNSLYFTTAYFHRPDEFIQEIEESGLRLMKTLAVDGVGMMLQNFEQHWQDKEKQDRLLGILRRLEEEPSLLGASAHLMAIARKASST